MHKGLAHLWKVLVFNRDILGKLNNLIPLRPNEWTCWTTIFKNSGARNDHTERLCAELLEGKRRPCCW